MGRIVVSYGLPMGWSNAVIVAVMAVFAFPLARIDIREHRLPDRLTLGLFLAESGVLTVTAAVTGAWPRLGLAFLGAFAMALFYTLLALIPNGMGFGDVKLALGIGLVSAWWSWSTWLLALLAAFICGALWVLVRLFDGRSLRLHVAFGPAMLLGWGVAALAALA